MEKYVLSDLIGEGSFGKVYKAVEKASTITVAIKIINKRGRSGRELKGLRGECEIQRNLKHPNIIRMLDSFETQNEIIVVTEYAKTDLHSLLRDGSLEEPKTQRITYNLVSALYYLHSHRILHRDLKPQNILLDRKMCAKLCDFGFARNMTMGTHVLTSIKGTPLYMAPELLEAKPYDHHADLWSLGCIIYEMLAGEPPFSSTSMIHLVRLIRNQYIKWPSYLTSNCISFVQGLLERDPSKRMSWASILQHPFVKGHILTIEEDVPQSPFTHPLTASQSREKKNQLANRMGSKNMCHDESYEDEMMTSKDSIKVILQSDVEYQETDTDDGTTNIATRKELAGSLANAATQNVITQDANCYDIQTDEHHAKIIQLLDNPNLVVTRFNDNFPIITLHRPVPVVPITGPNRDYSQAQPLKEYANQRSIRSQELERRKLSQSIDNFSMRIELEMQASNRHPNALRMSNISTKEEQQEIGLEKVTPSLLPGWDSCDESQNPPIENEEWLAFLHRSIQEVFDGELESLKQHNFVCIIVAPLRNRRASAKVVENVAHLLSLPLAINTPPTILRDIISVYGELKIVPNLVYASKLLCNKLFYEGSSTSETWNLEPGMNGNQSICSIRQLSTLDNDEIKTLIAVYDLMCHLIHMGDIFLNQFCDAIEILEAKELFVNFIAVVHVNEAYVRLVCSLLALLNCALRELPENAEIIEQIIFHENVNLMTLLKHDNAILRLRTCMLLRILARFSCLALQKRWTNKIKLYLEELLSDSNLEVKKEAMFAIDEFKYLNCVANEMY